MTAAAPSGVVTFLFTDVEGSTRRWEADADEMRIALAAHDEVLRGAIEAHGGWLFKHTGDGVRAAFASRAAISRPSMNAWSPRTSCCTSRCSAPSGPGAIDLISGWSECSHLSWPRLGVLKHSRL
jgi:class 3 adenylate cyclase